MKRTEKDIYDFVKKKLKENKEDIRLLTEAMNGGCLVSAVMEKQDKERLNSLLAKQEAYEEVLNFIGTIRTKGE